LWAETTELPRRLIRVAVLANDAPGVVHRRWGATTDYLTGTLPGYRFELVPTSFERIFPQAEEGAVDFMLVNPAQVVQLESRGVILPVATLKGRYYGGDYGGVIFWSARRFDIQGARDIRGRRVAAVAQDSLGGWLAQLLEYREAGIDLPGEVKAVDFLESHEETVRAVLEGRADLGFCRTGVLDAMVARGEIGFDAVRIGSDFVGPGSRGPRHHSTRLYPEWALLALHHVPRPLVEDVRRALFDMAANDPAALQSNTAGWMPAANYGEVRHCLRELKVAPFDREAGGGPLSPALQWALALVSLAGVSALLVCAILFLRLRSLRHRLEHELEQENVLGRSRSFLGAVLGSFPYPVVAIGLDYRVLLANPRAREAYGWHGSEDGIMPCHRFMRQKGHPCHDSGDECLLQKVIASGEPEVIRTTHHYADGRTVPVRVHGMPLFDAAGELHAVVEWAVDESEEPSAQSSVFPVN
jgi:PAS domain-containing protein